MCEHVWATVLEIDESKQSELLAMRSMATTAVNSGQRLTLWPLPEEVAAELLTDAIDVQASLTWPLESVKPIAIARFQTTPDTESNLVFRAAFAYAEREVNPRSPERILLNPVTGTRIKRVMKAENEYLRPLKGSSALRRVSSTALTRQEAQTLMPLMMEAGWRVELDQKPLVPYTGTKAVLGEAKEGFAFAAAFDYGDERVSLRSFTEACVQNGRFISLSGGRVGLLPQDWVKRIELLARSASFSKEGFLCLSRSTLPLFKPVFDEIPGLIMDPASKHLFSGLGRLAESGLAEKPSGLRADLRSYQAEGLFWLEKISASGFGGILADDMGLGKTVQVISYLLRRSTRQQDEVSRRPSLVVLPKSLVFNWVKEIEKFGPRLRVLDFASAKRGLFRPQDYDVVLTTYHVLKNELDRLEKVEFDTIILDEAQAIKNPISQVAQAVYRLKGTHRFALSGTPIENSLGDLFSLMRFANPGLIPSSLVTSIGDGRTGAISKEALERLSIAVSPFILRRTKSQVLKELPEKCEQTLLCELDASQKKLYDRLRRHYKDSLRNEMNAKSAGKTEMKVFEAILRLRQVSCHPGLVDKEQMARSSTKFDVLLDHLEEIRAAGHKALVFSQFTSLLELLKPHLKKAGLRFEYLDGQTRNRGAVVDRFNSEAETTVFLISLKAGGTGLNLTTASYVFLLDPWWNPAIESQAIDRAYRMGQKQKVMAYRLIAEGTIEEKIMRLQAQKRSLADSVISEDQSFLRTLSVDELASLFD
jgi:superfamily II DNA or RNA helicase